MTTEEVFGPVAPISRFETDSEVVERANDTEHGLAAYIYARDISRGFRVAAQIEAGMIALNRGLVSDPAAPLGASSRAVSGAKAANGTASWSSWKPNI